ncbi:MAG: YncE family protein [Nevskia sp.]|nr:YncE family protein [Nevskia sp.]
MRRCFPVFLVLLGCALAASADSAYQVVQRLPLGGSGGWDYPSVDAATHLLYLSRADHVGVVDTASGKDVGDIPDTAGVHGIALAPELGRGYVSCGKADQVKVFDLKTRAVLATVATGAGPDAIVYEPASRRVLAFNGRGHSASVIDAASNAVVATIPLDGKPEFARADGRGMVYVNIEDKAELAAIDARSAAVKAVWPLPHCEGPSGLALDAAHRRAFSTCDNQTLAVTDVDSGKAVARVAIGKGPDGAEFDPATQTVFSANGEGNVTVVRELAPDRYQVRQTLPTQRGARTIALDAATHRLYLPTADFGPAPPATVDNPHARPQPVPGTFVVLVVGAP